MTTLAGPRMDARCSQDLAVPLLDAKRGTELSKDLAKRAVAYIFMACPATTVGYFLTCSDFRSGDVMLADIPHSTPEQVQDRLATVVNAALSGMA